MRAAEKFGRRAAAAIVDRALGWRKAAIAAKYDVAEADVAALLDELGQPPRIVMPRGRIFDDAVDPPSFVERSQPPEDR